MTIAILLGALAGIGCVGLAYGVRAAPPSLDSIAAIVNRPLPGRPPPSPGASGMVRGPAGRWWPGPSPPV